MAKPTRDQYRIGFLKQDLDVGLRQVIELGGIHPLDFDPGVIGKPAVMQRLDYALVCIVKSHVLPH